MNTTTAIGITAIILLFCGIVATPARAQEALQALTITPSALAPGQRAVISGTGFGGYNTVVFAGSGSTYTAVGTSLTEAEVNFTAPKDIPTGTYSVSVTTRGATSNALTATVIGSTATSSLNTTTPSQTVPSTLNTAPTLVSLDPVTALPNQRVTITGTGFASYNNVVLVGSETSHTVEGASFDGTKIAFTVPHNISGGTYSVQVISRGITSNALQIGVHAPVVQPVPAKDPIFNFCIFGIGNCPAAAAVPTHVYVVLGDSIAAGFPVFKSYSAWYEEHIENATGLQVDRRNLSQTGLDSSGLHESLQTNPRYIRELREADYVTWNIGGNDMRVARTQYRAGTCGGSDNQDCLRRAVVEFRQNWDGIVSQIKASTNDGAVLRTMNIYYPYVDEDTSTDTWQGDKGINDYDELQPYVQAVNQHITGNSPGANVADIHVVFNGVDGNQDPKDVGVISFDGYHLNDTGHKIVAEQLRLLGL